MHEPVQAPATVKAPLNFAADRSNGGIWSNSNRGLITQALQAQEVEIRDARRSPTPPTLELEGFTVQPSPVADPAWTDEQWIAGVYVPLCLELVRSLTGAALTRPYYKGALIRDTGDARRAPAAEFVHLDNSRESALPFLAGAADAELRGRYDRIMVFNIWRPITPPPQDVPLALCDQRTCDEADGVFGRTVEPNFPDGVPYVTSVFNPAQRWWYFSDLTPDEAVVFKGWDSDPAVSMGCLHGAFKQPEPPPGATPRASIETRVFAFFDA